MPSGVQKATCEHLSITGNKKIYEAFNHLHLLSHVYDSVIGNSQDTQSTCPTHNVPFIFTAIYIKQSLSSVRVQYQFLSLIWS